MRDNLKSSLYQLRLLIAIVLLLFTSCRKAFYADDKSTPPPVMTRLMAELRGNLVEVEGCLRVEVNSDKQGSVLLVWPPDFVVRVEKGLIYVFDQITTIENILQEGEEVVMAGGEFQHSGYLDEQTQKLLPANCPGPYWLVGSVPQSAEEE